MLDIDGVESDIMYGCGPFPVIDADAYRGGVGNAVAENNPSLSFASTLANPVPAAPQPTIAVSEQHTVNRLWNFGIRCDLTLISRQRRVVLSALSRAMEMARFVVTWPEFPISYPSSRPTSRRSRLSRLEK